MKKKYFVIFTSSLFLFMTITGVSFAHTPFCSCFDNGDGTISCEGGFSDGSTAAGATIIVKTKDETIQTKGKMNEEGEFSFKKPETNYTVKMDAGDMHVVTIDSNEIFE